ncbi:MAG TPA: transglutaminase domain-containing protein [Thermoanaerobaculia bacterium]|jgi:transglutaminase-like putative cysteine protease|nr:transglutaminase domain-containing protein [Thermoanaerobaculia bacterium]
MKKRTGSGSAWRRRVEATTIIVGLLFTAALDAGSGTAPPPTRSSIRAFEATYVASVEQVPPGIGRLEVWVPLPSDMPAQQVRSIRIESPYPWSVRRERENGNSYLYLAATQPPAGRLDVRVTFEAERREVLRSALDGRVATRPEDLERYLKAERLVTLSPRVRDLARRITWGERTPEGKARAIYEWLVNTMVYDKTTPGWGLGDTERACDVQKGNCTDFHSVFISLARAEGIPARFVIGFPLKKEPAGTVPGYHCWAEFYLDGVGWVPVDASDASKTMDARRREYLFGNLDPDRIQFTVGRDLRLDPPPCAEPLNYFIYPHAEADGKPLTPVSIQLEYRNRPGGALAAGAR